MINTKTEFSRDAAGGGAHRALAALLVSWPGGTWHTQRSQRGEEQADGTGSSALAVATFRAALALLIIELLPGSGLY
jgi:hypothetical protein